MEKMLYYLGKGTEFKKEECKEYKTLKGALEAAAKDEEFVVWDENGQVVGSLTDNVPEGALQTNPDGSVPAFNEDGTPAGTVDAGTVAAVTGNKPANASQDDENADGQANGQATPENGQNEANPASEGEENEQQSGDEQESPQNNTEGQQDDENADGQANGQATPENGQNEANQTPQEDDKVIVPQGKMKVTVICDGSLNLRRSPAWGNGNICGRATRGQSYFVKEIHTVDGKKMVRTVGDVYLSGASEHVQFEQV